MTAFKTLDLLLVCLFPPPPKKSSPTNLQVVPIIRQGTISVCSDPFFFFCTSYRTFRAKTKPLFRKLQADKTSFLILRLFFLEISPKHSCFVSEPPAAFRLDSSVKIQFATKSLFVCVCVRRAERPKVNFYTLTNQNNRFNPINKRERPAKTHNQLIFRCARSLISAKRDLMNSEWRETHHVLFVAFLMVLLWVYLEIAYRTIYPLPTLYTIKLVM